MNANRDRSLRRPLGTNPKLPSMKDQKLVGSCCRIATVLAPIDFSDGSYKALRYAAALVRKFDANLHVVHVGELDFAPPGSALPGRNPLVEHTEEARSVQRHLQAMIGPRIAPRFHGRTGRAFDQIVRFAHELQADLIVMSTHGHSRFKHLLFGSNAERVVRHSSCPVLVVRAAKPLVLRGDELRIRSILVPIDFSPGSQEALRFAVGFAEQSNARLILLHVVFAPPPPGAAGYVVPTLEPVEKLRCAAETELRDFAATVDFRGVAYETEAAIGHPVDTICRYAQRHRRVDLIILATHGRTGFLHVLIGSVAEQVLQYARSPVLVVPRRAKNMPKAGAVGAGDVI